MTELTIASPNSPARWPYLVGGYACFALGGMGLFLPLLPTTVFWIGAATCFSKSSPDMYRRIVTWPRVGPVIHDFLAFGVISSKTKKAALIGMGLCAVLIGALTYGSMAMWFSWGGIAIAAMIVLSRPSMRPARSFNHFHSAGNCPFLAAVHTPFPMPGPMIDARLS